MDHGPWTMDHDDEEDDIDDNDDALPPSLTSRTTSYN